MMFSIPMSFAQWYLEKNSGLFKWKKWSIFHTFGSVSFTLFTIRGFIALMKRLDKFKNEYLNRYTYR